MKREKIYSLFRKNPSLTLFNKTYIDNDGNEQVSEQWLSDGFSGYVLENLPIFNEITLEALIGVPTDYPTNYTVLPIPNFLKNCIDDSDDDAIINLCKSQYHIFDYSVLEVDDDKIPERCFFINNDFLKPFSDDCEYTFYAKKIAHGKYAIIVKAGFIVKGITFPIDFAERNINSKIKFAELVTAELSKYIKTE